MISSAFKTNLIIWIIKLLFDYAIYWCIIFGLFKRWILHAYYVW